jgi:hypothetical protein
MTIMIASAHSAIRSAIDKRTVEVTLNNKITNVEGHLKKLEKAFVQKNMVKFSTDPSQAVRTISEKSLSFKAKGIPGLGDYEVTSEATPDNSSSEFRDILEYFDNIIQYHFDVPPSAYNSMNENEFSRSIVMSNIYFSRIIQALQQLTIKHLNNFIRTYISFSQPLIEEINKIINIKVDGEDKLSDGSGVEDENKTESTKERLEEIINSISVHLQVPNVGPNKTQFDDLDTFSESLDKVLDKLYSVPKELEDDPLTFVKFVVKEKILRKYLSEQNVMDSDEFPTIGEIDKVALDETIHECINLINAIKTSKRLYKQKANNNNQDDDNSGFEDSDKY